MTAISNRKARFEFEIFDTIEAGIELLGCEVKSVRLGKASLSESYAMIHHGQVWLENMQITPYEHNTLDTLEPKRSRRLLLHKAEIMRLQSKISEKGLTLIPLKAYFNKRGVPTMYNPMAPATRPRTRPSSAGSQGKKTSGGSSRASL